MKRVFYLGYYDTIDGNTDVVLSATNKMDYIIDSLIEGGFEVNIISASLSTSGKIAKGSYKTVKKGVSLKKFTTFFGKNRIGKWISRKSINSQIKKYLLKQLKEEDVLLVYHSLGYLSLPEYLKKKTGCKLVYEVEEIYSDVGSTKIKREEEIKSFEYSDSFLFPTKKLDLIVNPKNKPSIIIHGIYKNNKKTVEQFNDGRVHCVYAGTFDSNKGGALASIKAFEHLNEKFCLHVLGFGSQEDIKKVLNAIKIIQNVAKSEIIYHGLLKGKEYESFLQRCHIGLSTQVPEGIYNETSFPSKILSYLSNGLTVVTIRIPVIVESDIGKNVTYYDKNESISIANAIIDATYQTKIDNRNILCVLDEKFKHRLTTMLNS